MSKKIDTGKYAQFDALQATALQQVEMLKTKLLILGFEADLHGVTWSIVGSLNALTDSLTDALDHLEFIKDE